MPTNNQKPDNLYTPAWLHWLAVATVVCALPLLTLGAEVTTKKVGMIDQAPVRSPLHLPELVQEEGGWSNLIQNMGLGYVIEHSHRTVGWVVGLLAIALAVGLGRYGQRRWLRWAGLVALVLVSMQGVLGMLRVELDKREGPAVGSTVALIHGITAPWVFAFLVSVAIWTSKAWQRLALEPEGLEQDSPGQRPGFAAGEGVLALKGRDKRHAFGPFGAIMRPALLLVAVMYLQIVFGALMRHKEMPLGTRAHILLAFGVVAVAAWLGARVLQTQPPGSLARRAIWILWLLLAVQLMLGLETMLSKFDVRWGFNTGGSLSPLVQAPELVRSLHYLVGATTFAAAVVNALIAGRQVAKTPRPMVVPRRQLEGAL